MSTRVLITGAAGFAGAHLAAHCAAEGDEVSAISRSSGVDLLDEAATRAALRDARPAVVYHLAARAQVAQSWREPGPTVRDNLAMAFNLLEAVREEAPEALVVTVSSGEVYGAPERLPVDETAPLRPQNPYAVSKAQVDLLAGFYVDAHGLRIVRPRAFNHAGPGQKPLYAVASFARQVAAGLEAGDDPVRVVTGNPDTRRDFTDVRDVVRAYRMLGAHGEPGVYNVCSGRTASARELLEALGRVAGVRIQHEIEQSLVRKHDVAEIRGDARAVYEATGWTPAIRLEQTLADTVGWWREELRSPRV